MYNISKYIYSFIASFTFIISCQQEVFSSNDNRRDDLIDFRPMKKRIMNNYIDECNSSQTPALEPVRPGKSPMTFQTPQMAPAGLSLNLILDDIHLDLEEQDQWPFSELSCEPMDLEDSLKSDVFEVERAHGLLPLIDLTKDEDENGQPVPRSQSKKRKATEKKHDKVVKNEWVLPSGKKVRIILSAPQISKAPQTFPFEQLPLEVRAYVISLFDAETAKNFMLTSHLGNVLVKKFSHKYWSHLINLLEHIRYPDERYAHARYKIALIHLSSMSPSSFCDDNLAYQCLKEAADNKHLDAMLILAREHYAKNQLDKSEIYFKKILRLKNTPQPQTAEAHYYLGLIGERKGVPINKILESYSTAKELGEVRAANNLGRLYFEGPIQIQNPYKAIECFMYCYYELSNRPQTDLGFIHNMALIYRNKLHNKAEAYKWFELGAHLGDGDCMNSLGALYEKRYNKSRNISDLYKAAELYSQAAEVNADFAAENLAEVKIMIKQLAN